MRHRSSLLPSLIAFVLLATASFSRAADAVKIHVDAAKTRAPVVPFWNYFGYDEPNYTYAPNGVKLLKRLGAMSDKRVYIRTHNLFTSGDGKHARKWGSTNCYTEDAQGNPVYDWTIVDKIFDTYRDTKTKPLVQFGFMPEALSTKPVPYRHTWPKGGISTGWAYPPKDYEKWAGLVRAFVSHLVERSGKEEVESWPFELWNEPDIEYWRGTPEEFYKLYDYTGHALKAVLPNARYGGPEMTGPYGDNGAAYLNRFLDHCENGTNAATGEKGSPLDFITFHPKGSPKMFEGHVRMGLREQLAAIDNGFRVVSESKKYRDLPIILGESDPEGCAACPAATTPANAYRDGEQYGSYVAAMLDGTRRLADEHGVTIEGSVTWAFEFEDSDYFSGLRELATNGIDKPVLNVFRMFAQLDGRYVHAESDASLAPVEILARGVRRRPDIGVVAARDAKGVSVIVWHYHDDAAPGDAVDVDLTVAGFDKPAKFTEHRVDATHGNAFTLFKSFGRPQQPTPQQVEQLDAASVMTPVNQGTVAGRAPTTIRLNLPRQSVSLLRFEFE